MCLVWRKIQSVEAVESMLANVQHKIQTENTDHVCDLGNAPGSPDFSIVNRRGPSEPWRSLKPLTGIREVPVVN